MNSKKYVGKLSLISARSAPLLFGYGALLTSLVMSMIFYTPYSLQQCR